MVSPEKIKLAYVHHSLIKHEQYCFTTIEKNQCDMQIVRHQSYLDWQKYNISSIDNTSNSEE